MNTTVNPIIILRYNYVVYILFNIFYIKNVYF